MSRINLFGRDQTVSLRGNLGLLEQRVDFVYQYPHVFGNRNLSFSFTVGYNNSQDVVTYSASQLEGSLRLTEKFNGEHEWLSKANTFVYQFVYRRVKVNQSSIQIPADDIPLVLEAVRVGGPSLPGCAIRAMHRSMRIAARTPAFRNSSLRRSSIRRRTSISWMRRTPATTSSITTASCWRATRAMARNGPTASHWMKHSVAGAAVCRRWKFASRIRHQRCRATRSADRVFPSEARRFLINSTELRMPPPTLPYVGNSVSFVLFHDMGNVFTNSRDIWPSSLRFRQQDRAGCRNLTPGEPTGPVSSTGHDWHLHLRLLFARAGSGFALSHAGRAGARGLQLEPQPADLSGDVRCRPRNEPGHAVCGRGRALQFLLQPGAEFLMPRPSHISKIWMRQNLRALGAMPLWSAV